MKMIGIPSIENYDIFSKKGERAKEADREEQRQMASKVLKRMEACIRTSRNRTAMEWYQATKKTAEERIKNNNTGPRLVENGRQMDVTCTTKAQSTTKKANADGQDSADVTTVQNEQVEAQEEDVIMSNTDSTRKQAQPQNMLSGATGKSD